MGEPPGLISPSGVFPSPEIDKLLLWTDMSNPDDGTDVPSGFNDDAEMERTSPRVAETTTTRKSAPVSLFFRDVTNKGSSPPNSELAGSVGSI